ncbi:MAG: hypothetical protein RI894_1815, partial [Bacteroidota bacterium]
SLYNNIGQLVGTTLTDNSGFYNFGGLAAGTYSVGFTTPPGMVAVEQILNTATGSDNSPSTGRTPTFALVEGQNRTDIDAGFRLQENGKASIGDRVWLDVNRDGIQDANEVTGMAGIRVSLYRTDGTTLVAVTETDGLGYYSFTNLTPTGYIVGFDIPTAYTISPRNAGTNDALDSDADPVSGLTSIYLLLPNEANTTVDLGLYPTVTPPTYGSIGDFVWEDKDKNGLQNAGERGLPGVTVTLYAADGITVLAQTTTSANGFYSFNFLAAGDYILGFTNFPTNYTFTLQTLNTATGSDANSNGRTPLISLAAGQNRTDIDAGLFPSNPFDVRFGTIGDRVWRDDNTDGIQQTNEQGVGGISVYLLDNNSQIVGVTVTDATGYYGFSRLVAGTYSVQFNVLPQGAQFTTQNAPASTAANDSDADASGHTRTIVLTTGQVNLTIDAGIILEAILGDFVWLDTNSDHLQTNGEPGVPNITVNLFLASAPNAVVQTTMTDASGIYYFHVTPNNYIVGFVNGTGYTLVAQTLGTDNGSDADPSTGKTPAITIAAGQQNYDIDAGLRTNVLPVQLVYFVGTAEGCAVTLHWQTATEENNKQFVVQRSKNGQDFETIGTIAGAGSTNVAQNYSFDDKQPSFTNTYRLLQVDFDGTTTVYSASNLVRTTGCFDGTTSGITEIYPNPNFINTVWFKFYTEAAAEDVTVAVSDVFGRVLQSQVMTVQNGSNVVSIEIKGLTTGTYYIQVTGNGWFSPAQKLVRMWK